MFLGGTKVEVCRTINEILDERGWVLTFVGTRVQLLTPLVVVEHLTEAVVQESGNTHVLQ